MVGLWLPGGNAPPPAVVRRLEENDGILVPNNVDSDGNCESPLAQVGMPYVGMTDFLERATALRDL